ncbi:MAG: hypothetical protein ACOCYX_06015 [Spirochaetota bacterium]
MKRILAVIATVRFFVLVALMELNLLACTLPRLVRRLRRSRATKLTAFAPDVIHLGLATVIAGGFARLAFGQQWRYDGAIGGGLKVDDEVIRVTAAGELYTDQDVLAGSCVAAIRCTSSTVTPRGSRSSRRRARRSFRGRTSSGSWFPPASRQGSPSSSSARAAGLSTTGNTWYYN